MQRAPSRGRGRRSPVMVWLQQNRATLEAAFAQTAPAWNVLASYLGECGITDGDGKPPTARTAREAWGRVKAMAMVSARPPSKPPAVLYQPDGIGASEPDPAESVSRFADAKPARLRGHTPTPAPTGTSSVPVPAPIKRDADAEIARLLGKAPSSPEKD